MHMAPDSFGPNRRIAPFARVVGVDDGYSDIKICGGGLGKQTIDKMEVPGLAAFGSIIERGSTTGNIDGGIRNRWDVNGETFTVSPFSAGERIEFDDFHWSPENKVLIHHYLAEAGYSDADVDLLVVGLPMSSFFDLQSGGKSVNIDRKVANLLAAPVPIGETKRPPRSIKRVQVRPQGLLSFFDFCVNWDGSRRSEPPARVAVIDIGGRTTDLAFVVGGKEIDRKYSKSLNIGVINVLLALNSALRDRFSISIDFPRETLKEILRTRYARIRGQNIDVSDIVESAVKSVGGALWRQVLAEMEGLAMADLILLVGGGASVFNNVRPEVLAGAHIPDQPEYANVRGMWKFGFCQIQREIALSGGL